MDSRKTRSRTPTLCQNDRAGIWVRPELCRAPVRNTKLQAIAEVMTTQNATLMATTVTTGTIKENLSLIFPSSRRVKLKAKGRLPP